MRPEKFLNVIGSIPLVSIDIILKNSGDRVFRVSSKLTCTGYWFVPGGKVRKICCSFSMKPFYIPRSSPSVDINSIDIPIKQLVVHDFDGEHGVMIQLH